MFGKRVSIGTSVATVLAVSVATIGAGAAIAGSTEAPAWQKALHARSAALNQKYGLGDRASAPLTASSLSSVAQPDWLRALQLRSEAMNHRYGLGGEPRSAVTHVSRYSTVTNVRCYATARNSLSGLAWTCARPSPS
jgi:hypothetical protein